MEFNIGNVILSAGHPDIGKDDCLLIIQAIKDGDKDFEFEHREGSSNDWYDNANSLTFKKEGDELIISNDLITISIKWTKKVMGEVIAYLEAQI
jgi:hypothetical protein